MEEVKIEQEKNPIILERVTPSDVSEFLKLEQGVYDQKLYPSVENEKDALQEIVSAETFFIKKEGCIVGTIAYKRKNEDIAEITGVMIDPLYQGKGLGWCALMQVLSLLKECKRIEIVTHPENQKALALYKSAGFKVESRIEDYYGDGEPRFVLIKIL